MRSPTILTTLIACVLLLALPASAAWANAADDRIIADCQNSPTGALRGSYPQKQLNHALHNLRGDVREYTGCSEAIRQALLTSAGGGDGSGGNTGGGNTGGGGGTSGSGSSDGGAGSPTGDTGAGTPVPDAAPPAGADQAVDVAGAEVTPGTLPEIGQDSHRLPTPLLVLLVLVGVAALTAAALTIGRRVVGHRSA
ncbi:MAG TPA: hypothetical protein VGO48_02620 [Conexibacter sp.]|jgi:hypothetical protein|nr:hypothetical protein [Conexibacter sp.]